MKSLPSIVFLFCAALVLSSCVTNKKFISMQTDLQSELEAAHSRLENCESALSTCNSQLTTTGQENDRLKGELSSTLTTLELRKEQIQDLKNQIEDCKQQRDKQLSQVGDLTVLSQSASDNIKETLSQLEKKDKYIYLLQAAKSKVDSINLALAVNLKSVLKDGIEDKDVEIKVDKTVVFINLSDKMLYESGSAKLTAKANEVLGKIAQIIETRKDLDVMVEGYTDNVPIKTACIEDNWDLSVKRATSVVRVLQNTYYVDPNKLVAAGRGEYNILASNDTPEGRSVNRRTRIIILPKLNQFYDLLNPANAPK
jgi:chemotaxis protein MotB